MIRRLTLSLAAVTAIACAAGGGVPRLIGTGCEARPFGVALAIEESDFMTQCRRIEPLWTSTGVTEQ